MWKQINKEQIKDYPVGTKVRIDGKQETEISKHYGEGDYGFNVTDSFPDCMYYHNTFANSYWSFYSVEIWVESEELTPCEERGYKVGDRFVDRGSISFTDGSIVELYRDDETISPLFKLIRGDTSYCKAGGELGAYTNLRFVKKIEEDKEEQVETFELKPGVYFEISDMTQEHLDAIIEIAEDQGFNAYSTMKAKKLIREKGDFIVFDMDNDFGYITDFIDEEDDFVEWVDEYDIVATKVTYKEILGISDEPKPIWEVEGEGEGTTLNHDDLLRTIDVLSSAGERVGSGDIQKIVEDLCAKAARKFN